jgi:hypothetical protein
MKSSMVKTYCKSYSKYIKNTWVLLLQMQFNFLMQILKNLKKK